MTSPAEKAIRAEARAQLAELLRWPDGRTLAELVLSVNLIFVAGDDWAANELYRSVGLVGAFLGG